MSEVKASGRTPKLTPERQKKLCEYIRQGNSLRAAAAMAGISLASFYVWMKRGRRELDRLEADPSASPRRSETPCVRFWSAVDLSMAEAEARHLRVIDEAAQGGKELVETVVVLGQVAGECLPGIQGPQTRGHRLGTGRTPFRSDRGCLAALDRRTHATGWTA